MNNDFFTTETTFYARKGDVYGTNLNEFLTNLTYLRNLSYRVVQISSCPVIECRNYKLALLDYIFTIYEGV